MYIDMGMLVFIFIINFVYIMLNIVCFLFVMWGYWYFVVFVSVIEIMIYVLGLLLVLNCFNNLINLVVYVLGYGVGVYVGMVIEDWLVLGYIMILVILFDFKLLLLGVFCENGFGVI